jgi:hypothetical protein
MLATTLAVATAEVEKIVDGIVDDLGGELGGVMGEVVEDGVGVVGDMAKDFGVDDKMVDGVTTFVSLLQFLFLAISRVLTLLASFLAVFWVQVLFVFLFPNQNLSFVCCSHSTLVSEFDKDDSGKLDMKEMEMLNGPQVSASQL